MDDLTFLQAAIAEASESITQGGGPFGAVIVRDGVVLSRGQNRVTKHLDPTAHAEVVAIRAACQRLVDHRLGGATLYASTEPCPLCLAAIYWARIDRVVYASTRHDAAAAGFDDAAFYRELSLPEAARSVAFTHVSVPAANAVLERWIAIADKIPY